MDGESASGRADRAGRIDHTDPQRAAAIRALVTVVIATGVVRDSLSLVVHGLLRGLLVGIGTVLIVVGAALVGAHLRLARDRAAGTAGWLPSRDGDR